MVWMKMHDGNELAKSKCRMPCFVQQDGDFLYEEGSRVLWSCFRSVREYGICGESLLELVVAAM